MPKNIVKTVYTLAELKERADNNEDGAVRAFERAMNKVREWQCDDSYWHEYTIEMWENALNQIGFLDAKIQFSGFWSQGDGASFTASVDETLLIEFLANPPEASDSIDSDGKGGENFLPWLVGKAKGVQSNTKFSRLQWLVESGDIRGLTIDRTGHHYSHEHTCKLTGELNDAGKWSADYKTWLSKTPRVRQLFDDFVESAEQLRLDLSHAIYRDLESEYKYLTSDEQILEMAAENEYQFTIDGKLE